MGIVGYERFKLERLEQQAYDEERRLFGVIKQLEGQNAKLRELAVELFECARTGEDCEVCRFNNDGYACVYVMRELGIEVDG